MGVEYQGKPGESMSFEEEVKEIHTVNQTKPSSLQNLVNATAATMDYHGQTGILNPLANDRIIAIKNTGNQSVDVKIYPYLNGIGSASSNVQLDVGTITANGGVGYVTNGQLNEISAPFDSLSVGINYTTLPTSGGVSITIQERV